MHSSINPAQPNRRSKGMGKAGLIRDIQPGSSPDVYELAAGFLDQTKRDSYTKIRVSALGGT